jgi:hypothetical protein
VDFERSYHAILGRSCYAKFMAIPNYTYLKPKMPGPNGIITVSGSSEQAYVSVFYRLPTEGIPEVVSLGEETPRLGTRRCKEHKILDRFGPRGA